MQKFLRDAVNAGCSHAVIEITSEGAKQFRHKLIDLDMLVFTNLSPEHIESHGSYERYRKAKLSIADELEISSKKETTLIVNGDDPESSHFLKREVSKKIIFSLKDAEPYSISTKGIQLMFNGEQMTSPLVGQFNIYNIVAAATTAKAMGIKNDVIKNALRDFSEIKGRVERVNAGQDFDVIVDYAHTIDSLEKLYRAFDGQRKICVLGNTGGGRDKWKRPGMAKVAETYCDHIILTNEDPYDEDPQAIVDEMKAAITSKPCEIIMDRREAIARALGVARADNAVLISGKGTDPYIMGPNGSKIPWSDEKVAREELQKVLRK
jgi:UDP-N-acetylmuramoyl-L-alanyl-D-glutamate--2,6-diaminopimelate ligase